MIASLLGLIDFVADDVGLGFDVFVAVSGLDSDCGRFRDGDCTEKAVGVEEIDTLLEERYVLVEVSLVIVGTE